MANIGDIRIAGVSLPAQKHTNIALTYIFGIGHTRANDICDQVNIAYHTKLKDLEESQIDAVREAVSNYTIEGDLRRQIAMDKKQHMDMRNYRGLRHKKGLPVRGQQTKNNARTRKGRKGRRGSSA